MLIAVRIIHSVLKKDKVEVNCNYIKIQLKISILFSQIFTNKYYTLKYLSTHGWSRRSSSRCCFYSSCSSDRYCRFCSVHNPSCNLTSSCSSNTDLTSRHQISRVRNYITDRSLYRDGLSGIRVIIVVDLERKSMRPNLYGHSPSDFRYTPLPSCTLGNIRNLLHLYTHMYISFYVSVYIICHICIYHMAYIRAQYLFREARTIFSLRQLRARFDD